MYFIQKIETSKNAMLPFPINLILGPVFLAPKISKQQFFSLYATVTSHKKSEIFNASICYKTQKIHFEPLFPQKPQCKIFLKKIIRVDFQP